jgi:VCBS repeat-containing protein
VVQANGVLANDTDADGDLLTARLVDGPAHGQLTLNADGSFTYSPEQDYYGEDRFTYVANDGAVDSGTATVTIAIAAVNDAPVAGDDAYALQEDRWLSVEPSGLLENDHDVEGDNLTVTLAEDPAHSQFFRLIEDGSFLYVPADGYNGTDRFTYRCNDGQADSNAATVTITVGEPRYPGDANLDGRTNVLDFNEWNAHKFTSPTTWLQGDFDGNGRTDVRDFNIWNEYKFTSAPAPAPVDAAYVGGLAETGPASNALVGLLEMTHEGGSAQSRTSADRVAAIVDKLLASYW